MIGVLFERYTPPIYHGVVIGCPKSKYSIREVSVLVQELARAGSYSVHEHNCNSPTYSHSRTVDGIHRKLTILQKLPSPCRAQVLPVSSHINSSNTRGRKGGREEGRGRERESERER